MNGILVFLQLTFNIHFLPPFKAQIVICHMVTEEFKQVKIDVKASTFFYHCYYICFCDPTLMACVYICRKISQIYILKTKIPS
jgi:hypothetical protein